MKKLTNRRKMPKRLNDTIQGGLPHTQAFQNHLKNVLKILSVLVLMDTPRKYPVLWNVDFMF